MRNDATQTVPAERQSSAPPRDRLSEAAPLPTAQFRRRAWLEFQRALDPLGPPRPLRLPRS
jgi:hypothetical protein